MNGLKSRILKSLLNHDRSKKSLIIDFGENIITILEELKSEQMVNYVIGTGRLAPMFNITLTQKGKLMLDNDYCSACECTPCDCNWGHDE
tara:strand:- start:186 stop:455 length:270 start_codon:yes stop_codon:yes gene_type:complete